MSYILEALRKSEQERQLGTPPTLPASQPLPPSPTPRPVLLRYGLAAGLLLAIGVAIGWLQPWRAKPVAADREPVVASAAAPLPARLPAPVAELPPPAEMPRPAAAAVAEPLARPVPPPPATTIAAPAALQPAARAVSPRPMPAPVAAAAAERPSAAGPLSPAPASAATPAPAGPPTAALPPQPSAAVAPQVAASFSPATATSAPVAAPTTVPPRIETSAAVRSEPVAPAKATPAAAGDGTPEPRIVPLAELPAAVQQELPKIAVALHAYSSKPQDRLVSINDRLLSEGDYVVPGLRLEQITPDGMVLSFRGYRFSRGVK